MAAASGLDKFRFMDELSAKLDADSAGKNNDDPVNVHVNGSTDTPYEVGSNPASGRADSPDVEVAAAAASAASRLFSLHRDLATSMASPADILRHLEATARAGSGGRGGDGNLPGIDRLTSLAAFGFPGLGNMPPLAPITSALEKDNLALHPGLKQALNAEKQSENKANERSVSPVQAASPGLENRDRVEVAPRSQSPKSPLNKELGKSI